MSFLSRRPSRSGNRASDAGPADEYDDYEYAPDGYARGDQDDTWSANEYFSPDGIKGRWAAGHQPGDQPAVRPNRYQDGGDSFQGGAPAGYGADEYATGGYELPEGTADERGERGGRRRKTTPSLSGRLRLRRDRGEDIWPDDGVSDEDYWASVAADRPLTPADPPGPDPAAAAGNAWPPAAARPAAEGRSGAEPRGGTGRLGPAPGLAGDYQPASGGPWPGQAARNSGGFPRNSGGLAPNSGGSPRNSGAFPQSEAPQPSFRPNGSDSRPATPDRTGGDWGERTERIERVTATGYPDPRASGRPGGAPGRGRDDAGREPGRTSGGWPAADRTSGAWPTAGRSSTPARTAGDEDPLTSTAYSRAAQSEADGRSYRVAARRSQAQAKLTEETQTFSAPVSYSNDRYPAGQYQAGQYQADRYQSGPRPVGQGPAGAPPSPRYPTGMTGEYGQYMADTSRHGADKYGADTYSPEAYGDQYRAGQPRSAAEEPTAQYPAYGSHPQAAGHSGRVTLPGASGAPTGSYPAQPSQQSQASPQSQASQQPWSPQSRQTQPQQQPQRPQAQQPRPSSPSAAPSGGNPYDSAVTGSYPYPGQAGYPARAPQPPPGPTAPGAHGRDDRRRRPAPPDGYGAGR